MLMMTEKGSGQIIAHVGPDLADAFKEMCKRRKQPQVDVFRALVSLWLNLPLETQARMISEDEPVESAFESVIRRIVEQTVIDAKDAKRRAGHKSSKAG